MRTRWQDWVIAIALVALGVTGIWTIWGPDIVQLFRPADVAQPAATRSPAAREPAPARTTVAPPAGPAQGPF